jgi:hypothetical protein
VYTEQGSHRECRAGRSHTDPVPSRFWSDTRSARSLVAIVTWKTKRSRGDPSRTNPWPRGVVKNEPSAATSPPRKKGV